MSFERILAKHGIDVNLIKIMQVDQNGYIEKQETVLQTKMIVLPLKAEERKFWQGVGITKATMKAYTNEEVETGWQVEINGVRYNIRAYENYGQHKKLILEAAK